MKLEEITSVTDAELDQYVIDCNIAYRMGEPIVSDTDYDNIILAELARRNPNHPFLHEVEPEPSFGKTVPLPAPMLSTDKAYTKEAIERWMARVEAAAIDLGKNPKSVLYQLTPKLDGYAAYDDGRRLYTRGDGKKGTDITRAFERGLRLAGEAGRGLGAGEIVVSKSYFTQHLAGEFENSRNFQASVIKEGEWALATANAVAEGAAVFYPFSYLPSLTITGAALLDTFDDAIDGMWNCVDFDTDGVVLEVIDKDIKHHMGATRHHHRWQIAYKQNTLSAQVRVLGITPQTSRSGRLTPVAELEPTQLSGAVIQRATAHHYKMVVDTGLGAGAVVQLVRSGEVIPKIEAVIEPVEPDIPSACPSCGASVEWEGDHLMCTNSFDCPAQTINAIEHFFETLGNVDGFGSATIEALYQKGVRNLVQIYHLTEHEFQHVGFGPKQAQNLVAQLLRSRTEQIEDWRFLAAFGVFRMGLGNCERLLTVYPLNRVFSLTEEDVKAVEGFAETTAKAVVSGFDRIQHIFGQIHTLGWNLKQTYQADASELPLFGKTIVFTGTMHSGSREDMERHAKSLGAKVGSAVSGKTSLLVAGESTGATKLAAAKAKGVKIISESEYTALCNL